MCIFMTVFILSKYSLKQDVSQSSSLYVCIYNSLWECPLI